MRARRATARSISAVARTVVDATGRRPPISETASGADSVKNLLLTGAVSIHYVSEIISQARGNEFQVRPHHMVAGVDVNIIRTIFRGQSWYIKWYFMEPDCVFISVHN